MKNRTINARSEVNNGPTSRTPDLIFGGEMSWFQNALGTFTNGTISYLAGRPGCGKSTLALQAAAEVASQGRKSLVILTEQSRDRAENRLHQVISHHLKRDQKLIKKLIHFEDSLGDVSYLPDYLLRRISHETHTGKPYEMVVLDSVNSGVPGAASKVYKKIFDAFALLRGAGVSLLGVGQATKDGKPAGPNSLAHETDVNMLLSTAWHHRYLTVVKNRNGAALGDPICLEMSGGARLIPSPHQGAMAATVSSFLPGDYPEVQMQIAISLPPYGETGRVLCPNLPRLQISQLIDSLQRSTDLEINLSAFVTNIQLVGESLFRKSLHLPLAMGVVGSFCQKPIPEGFMWLGELDLNLGLRPLPENVRLSLETAIESDALPSGTTVVVPSKDASTLANGGSGVRVIGVGDLHEALALIEPKKVTRTRKKRTTRKGAGGTPAPRGRSRKQSRSARSRATRV
jgi:DNA repair protein RadA/Sms